MLSETEMYLTESIEKYEEEIKKNEEKIQHFELEKEGLFFKLDEIGNKIDAAYDVFSPQSVKNDFYKEQIKNFEKKIEEINCNIEENKTKIQDCVKEVQKLKSCLEEISLLQKEEQEPVIEKCEEQEIQCIDISKIEKNDVLVIDTVPVQNSIIRDLIYKCENCSAFMRVDINRSRMELETVIKSLKSILNEEYIAKNEEQKTYINPFCDAEENDDKIAESIARLTVREQEILALIAQGMLNKEIANELNITERTVKNHISNIFKKINVYDRTQAAVFAIKNKICTI